MLNKITTAIGDTLVSNGVNLIGKLVKDNTENGLRKLGDMVKDATGIDILDENTVEHLTHEQYETLQNLEKVKANELTTMVIEYAKIAAKSTESARNMQETIIVNSSGNWLAQNFIYLFAIFWSIFAAGYILFITFFSIPSENQRFADTILGFMLGTVIASILQFFFGSSMKLPASTTTTKTMSR